MERTFLERSEKMSSAKDALGRAAANLVQDGETVVLDSGTTTQYIARHLIGRVNLAVVTNSLAVLEELGRGALAIACALPEESIEESVMTSAAAPLRKRLEASTQTACSLAPRR